METPGGEKKAKEAAGMCGSSKGEMGSEVSHPGTWQSLWGSRGSA